MERFWEIKLTPLLTMSVYVIKNKSHLDLLEND